MARGGGRSFDHGGHGFALRLRDAGGAAREHGTNELLNRGRNVTRRREETELPCDVLERACEVRSGREAILSIARERPRADEVELDRCVGHAIAQAWDWLEEQLPDRVHVAAALEQPPRREHLDEDDAHREDIASPIELLAVRLLGRHVRELSFQLTGPRLRDARIRPRDAEVREPGETVDADEDVVRGDVAMNEALFATVLVDELVRGMKTCERIEDNPDRHAGRDLPLLLDRRRNELGGRRPLDVIHDEEIASLVFVDFQDGDDVRVADACSEARLVEEHVDERRLVGEVRMELLDRVETFEASGTSETSEVDGAHSTARDPREDLVAPERLDLGSSSGGRTHAITSNEHRCVGAPLAELVPIS